MDSRTARQEALEAKKRRLEELRARRNNRNNAVQQQQQEEPQKKEESKKGNLDDYIDGLLSSKAPSVVATETTTTTTDTTTTTTTTTPAIDNNNKDTTTTVGSSDNEKKDDSVAAVIPTVKVETFTMGTQTEDDFPPKAEVEGDDDAAKKEEESKEELNEEEEEKDSSKEEARLLSEDQANETLSSEPFSNFFVTASKKVERLLGAPVLVDLLEYSPSQAAAATTTAESSSSAAAASLVNYHVQLECPKWTSTRDCTYMDWSPNHRELMLASYHTPSNLVSAASPTAAGNQPNKNMAVSSLRPDKDTPSASLLPRSGELQSDGLALVWSLAMPTRPEHIFTCASPVLTSKFHPTEHHLIVGGCQSGQLVVWDIRAGRLPVQRSSLPTVMTDLKGHAHPICAMEIIESGSGLMTADSDGRLNFWSLSNLRDPAETFVIPNGNVSSLAVAPESNSIVCGDENGSLHTILASSSKKSSSSSRRAYRTWNTSENFGMITGVSTKTSPSNKQNSTRGLSRGFVRGGGGLVLTSGVDWTTKLWAPAYSDKPLLTLLSHSYDYMCDVQWSPLHPSVFATASSNGSLGIWNLASSLDEPLTGSEGIVVDEMSRGLNKIKWSLDGRRIAVACADKLHVLGLADNVWKSKGDDESRMMNNLKSRGLLDAE